MPRFAPLTARRDDAYAVERAANPLHCPRIDSELFGNDADTGPPRSRQGLADSFFQYRGNRGGARGVYPLPSP